ncbi:hypothetical protein [Evansella clarkii]|uniref:hypothetical protein n=1 Tax=Evansella clarkii TaxID=79879 RepID=UPI000B433B43|nr:hypothetical protein [Evansella clarkii]
MKKLLTGLLSLALVAGIGTTVAAQSDNFSGFQEMLPFMQKMHPDMSEEDLETMYNRCHGKNGSGGPRKMMPGANSD